MLALQYGNAKGHCLPKATHKYMGSRVGTQALFHAAEAAHHSWLAWQIQRPGCVCGTHVSPVAVAMSAGFMRLGEAMGYPYGVQKACLDGI